MHDINFIRNFPNEFDKALAKRKLENRSDEIIAVDKVKRKKMEALQKLQAKRNLLSKKIGERIKTGQDALSLQKDVELLKKQMQNYEEELDKVKIKLDNMLLDIPNILSGDVPEGDNESFNKEIFRSDKNSSNREIVSHDVIGKELEMMDFDKAVRLAGSRFVILYSDLARLERALCNFMVDLHVDKHNYLEVSSPHIVNSDILKGTGQLPKFSSDLFKLANGQWLIPTAEVTLTNLFANSILEISDLPLRFVSCTSCFRSEAGASGKDTKGMIRLHEFKKVELVSLVEENQSENELDRLINCATETLKLLDLPYRKMLLCSGDTGFSACKTIDLEVWLPSQKKYREISSCSNCLEFQARRMKTRYKNDKKEKKYVHTLNGSGLAVGRTLLAILENNQINSNRIKIPKILEKYMQGQKEIGFKEKTV